MNTSIQELDNGIRVVAISGDLDLYNANKLKELMQQQWDGGARGFVFDLDTLNYLDSSGIGVLLYVYTSCQKRRLPIAFARVHGSVQKVIKLTKLNDFLPIEKTVEAGIAKISGTMPEEADVTPHQKGILVDSRHPLLDTSEMWFKEFHIDIRHVRRLSSLIAQRAPAEFQEVNILEQQISELIKNAVKHGNKNDPNKAVRIWFSFNDVEARMVVEDEGEGFQSIDEWNEFFHKKNELFEKRDFDAMMNFLSYRTENSDDHDGGNAMFAAVEYWNGGVVFSNERNKVGVKRIFE